MNRIEWLNQVKLLASIWPNQPLPAETIGEWERLLVDFDDNAVGMGIRRLAKTQTMRPGAAELIQAARSVMAERRMQAVGMNLLPPADVDKMLAADNRPMATLMRRLMAHWRRGTVPTEWLLIYTDPLVPGRYFKGQVTQEYRDELTVELDRIDRLGRPYFEPPPEVASANG